MDSEVWGDADVVANTYRRGSTRPSVTAKLENPGAFKQSKAALAADPPLAVDTRTTREYSSKQYEVMTKVIRFSGLVVCATMAIGAVFGARNTMSAHVATRARDLDQLPRHPPRR